jgi:hypothetical protein
MRTKNLLLRENRVYLTSLDGHDYIDLGPIRHAELPEWVELEISDALMDEISRELVALLVDWEYERELNRIQTV